ncbi:MAG: nitroreductase family protein [Desulfovibrio sp.]|jgi:nitroreductase|nr:nitroreductase family protein [Desulfovibrio sp.]
MSRPAALVALLLVFALAAPAWADRPLPAPRQEGGMGVFEALKKRSSAAGGDFSPAELSQEELSNLLWAASGLNRGQTGWTVPMAHGRPPYCRVYVADKDGVFLYDWASHSLKEIRSGNIKGDIGAQSFVKKAAAILIFVADGQALAEFGAAGEELSHVAAGAMTQNVYLAAAALGLGARYIRSIRQEAVISALSLPKGDTPICLMLLGK